MEMADRSELHTVAAPLARQFFDTCAGCQGIVAAGRDDAWEWQWSAGHREPALCLQSLHGRIACRKGRFKVRWRGQQRANDVAPQIALCPMREHGDTRAVR